MKETMKKVEIAYEEDGVLKAEDIIKKTSDEILDELRIYANSTSERKLVFIGAVEDTEVEVEEKHEYTREELEAKYGKVGASWGRN